VQRLTKYLFVLLLLGCADNPAQRYAKTIEVVADSVVIMRDSSGLDLRSFEAHLAEKARDFEAVTPPPELANLHNQLVPPIQRLAVSGGTYTRAQLADALEEYLEARRRADRMLSSHGVKLGPPPPSRDLLAYWRRP
jgi:hypothetical protein